MPISKPTNLNCNYGAPMGRSNAITYSHKQLPLKFYLVKVALVDGCYDSGGAYWGSGMQLWRAESNPYQDIEGYEEIQEMFFRAKNRESAKKEVQREFPCATFYR